MSFHLPLFVGSNRIHLKKVDSTNKYAQNLLAKSKPAEGTTIIADFQSDGKGQMGSTWQSEPDKNATFSIILYPAFLLPRQQFELNKAVALGVLDGLRPFVPDTLSLKWPNDLYAGHFKIGGILIQNQISGHAILASIIGIGINVNQTQFSPDIPNPSSLYTLMGKKVSLPNLLESVFVHVEARYLQLKNRQFDKLQRDYLNHLYLRGVESVFQLPDGTNQPGKITGVETSGKLLIEISGEIKSFDLKEIRFPIMTAF